MVLRVLALHGFGQNAAVFLDKRVKELVRKLRNLVELCAMDGPHALPFDSSLRAWWTYSPELWDGRSESIQALAELLLKVPSFEPAGLQESVEVVLAEWSRGGYDGIMGFSQGAVMAAAVCCELSRRGMPAPRFALLCAGFGRPVPSGLEAYPPAAPLLLPSLHLWGSGDDHILGWASEQLTAFFEKPRVYIHDGGHFWPQKAPDVDAVRDFLVQFVTDSGASPAFSQPEGRRPACRHAELNAAAAAGTTVNVSATTVVRQASALGSADELAGALRRYSSGGGAASTAEPASPKAAVPVAAASSVIASAVDESHLAPDGAPPYTEAECAPPGPGTFKRLLILLRREGTDFAMLGPHPPCLTSEDSVRVRLEGGWQGVTLNSGAKAMLLRAPGEEERWILAVLPADKKLSWKKVRALKGKATRMAIEEEVMRVAACLPGAVPPFAAAFPVSVECLLDASMPSMISFNCGLRTRSIRMSRVEYERVQQPSVVDIVD